MTWADVGEIILKIVAYLGGGAVIVGGVAAFVAKIIADRTIERRKAELSKQIEEKKTELAKEVERFKGELAKDTETHKLKLRKAEILFQKEIEAVSQFALLRRQIYPQYSHPDMDWSEACAEVVEHFAEIHRSLEKFLVVHGAAIKAEIRKAIYELDRITDENKFAGRPGGADRTQAERSAGKFLIQLSEIEDQLLESLRE